MEHTNLGRIGIRDRVNLECDMVGKYVVRAAELAGLDAERRPAGGSDTLTPKAHKAKSRGEARDREDQAARRSPASKTRSRRFAPAG